MAASGRAGLILQHGDDGPPAILGEWLDERGIEHEVHSTWREPLPASPGDYGWIASLGSEHTPGAEGAPSWVDAEIEFLRRSLALEVPVLGLCFGGQALALAAGGAVARSEPPEIGWIEVETSDPELIPPGPWLHFHYDLIAPPPDSEVVAWSPAGPAAFVLGELARAPVPSRVDPGDRRRVGAARLRAARSARDRRHRLAGRRRERRPGGLDQRSSTPGGSWPHPAAEQEWVHYPRLGRPS